MEQASGERRTVTNIYFQVTRTAGGSTPTKAMTTTYTVTDCPSFDPLCQTGQVTTRTLVPAKETASSDGGDDTDSAAGMLGASGFVAASFAAMVVVVNAL